MYKNNFDNDLNEKAFEFIKNNFITIEQYDSIFSEDMQNLNLYENKNIQWIEENIKKILTDEQKILMRNCNITTSNLAKALIYYGRFVTYRFSYLHKILPSFFFIDENRELLTDIINGKNSIFIKNKITEKIKPQISISSSNHKFKNIKSYRIFDNHEQMTSLIRDSKKHISVPKILVNFDSHSDIYVNHPTFNYLCDWVNTAIIENNLTDVYWVCPSKGLYLEKCFNYYFGHNNNKNLKSFFGIYDEDLIYNNLNKPLTQKFIINKKDGMIISDSVNYSEKEFKNYINKPEYQEIKIHTCTKENLPKINEDFILSIDADYFICSGFDSNPILESIPFNINYIFNDFIEFLQTELNNASILGLCLSPEYIGLDSIPVTTQFFNYLTSCINS